MKKFLPYILLVTIIFTGVLAPIHQAEAWIFIPFLIKSAAVGVATVTAWNFANDTILSGTVSVALWILDLIQTLAATLMSVAHFLLDFVVDKTIINSNLGTINAVNIGWEVARDLVNMFFIFILLYIAIATILNIGNYKKTLITLVIVALVVNFSLFATKIVIDASNVVAIGLYNNMALSSNSLAGTLSGTGLKIQKTFQLNEDDELDDKVREAQVKFLSIIFLLVTAWVLFNAAFLLVGRFVAFIFLMILSPIAFVSFILPGLKSKIFNKWWETLVNQALVAPIFFFLFYIIVKIIEQDPFVYATAEDLTGTSILFNFVVLIGLMIAALKITRNTSGSIGAAATGWGKKATGLIAGGAVGLVGRRVIGRAARGATESAAMKQWAAKSRVGRATFQTLDRASGASFDVRAAAPKAGLGKATGRGGYTKYAATQKKKIQAQAARIGKSPEGEILHMQAEKREFGSYHTRDGKKIEIKKGDKMPKLDDLNYAITNEKGELQYETTTERYARTLEEKPKGALGKLAKEGRALTGRDSIEREAAKGIRKGETGKDSPYDNLKKEVEKKMKEEAKEKAGEGES